MKQKTLLSSLLNLWVEFTTKSHFLFYDSKDIKSNVDNVSEVLTILDVPLLDSPQIGFSDLANEQRTLRTEGVDLDLVKKEFLTSPIYKNLLMSSDSTTTVLVVYSKDDKYFSLLNKRNNLREISLQRELSSNEKILLKKSELDFKNYSAKYSAKEKENKKIRKVVSKYKKDASMFLEAFQ